MPSADTVEKDIKSLRATIQQYQDEATVASERGNDEGLSIALMRLARANSALGKHAAYAAYLARNAEKAYKVAREQIKLDAMEGTIDGKKRSGTYADSYKTINSQDGFNIFSNAQLIADQASDLCYRTDTFLKMAQSRLSLIKGDKQRA